jgi:hypothetical protein
MELKMDLQASILDKVQTLALASSRTKDTQAFNSTNKEKSLAEVNSTRCQELTKVPEKTNKTSQMFRMNDILVTSNNYV